MTPRQLAERLLQEQGAFEVNKRTGDTIVVQILIDGSWYNINSIDPVPFFDPEGTSNVVALKGVPA